MFERVVETIIIETYYMALYGNYIQMKNRNN